MSKICIISQYFIPDIGGAVTRISNLIKILNKLNISLIIVTTVPHYPNGNIPEKYKSKRKYVEKNGKITVIRLRMPVLPHDTFRNRLIIYLYFILMTILVLPSIGKIDLIWITSPNFFGNIIGSIFKSVKRVPLILNVDDLWPDIVEELGILKSKSLSKLANLINFFAYNYCDYITPISTMIKRHIIDKYNIKPNKLHVIEVGIDYYTFMKMLSEKRKELGVLKESEKKESGELQPIFVYSGILGPAYDFEILLRAVKILEDNKESFKLIIHGEGPLELFIRSRIRQLRLTKTKLVTHFLSTNEYLKLLLNASLFLLPMKKGIFSETAIPAKLFTYLMLDKPIISFKGGDVERILDKSRAGISIGHNYEDLANFLQLIIRNKTVYSKYCGNGSIYAKNHFDLNIMKKKVKRMISVVC